MHFSVVNKNILQRCKIKKTNIIIIIKKKKIVFNEVQDQLASLRNTIFSTNSMNIAANNYDPTKRAGNSVPEKFATNGLHPEAV